MTLLFCNICFSQNINTKKENTLSKKEKEKLENEFKERLHIQFSKVVTGNSFSNFGNFASINSDEKSLSASINIIEKRGFVINLNASGGATNGISEIFSEGDLNSNVAFGTSFHFLRNSNSTRVGRDIAIRNKLNTEKKKIKDAFIIDSFKCYKL